jgi:hypothetical protein
MLSDRSSGEDGLPEIPQDDLLDIHAILHRQRLIQAEMVGQDLEIALGGVDIQQQMDRVP